MHLIREEQKRGSETFLLDYKHIDVLTNTPFELIVNSHRFLTFNESVVMLMEGFLAVTAVLEPHLLFLPAAAPLVLSVSPSEFSTPGDGLLPVDRRWTFLNDSSSTLFAVRCVR